MDVLWRQGIMYVDMLLFVSNAASYQLKAGRALCVIYPTMIGFTCVAHEFHRAAEVVRDNYPKADL